MENIRFFGRVTEGQSVVDSIAQSDTIIAVHIIRKGKEARKFDAAATFENYFLEKDKVKNDKRGRLIIIGTVGDIHREWSGLCSYHRG